MKLQTLYLLHRDRFDEAREDIPWNEVTKALDEGDSLLVARLIRGPLEDMADAVRGDSTLFDVDYEVDRILQREIDEEAA